MNSKSRGTAHHWKRNPFLHGRSLPKRTSPTAGHPLDGCPGSLERKTACLDPPRRRVKSASLIKLPILHAYMLASEKGMLEHSEIIQQHLVKMIRFSSNESTNWILEKLEAHPRFKNLDQSSMYHELKLVEYIPEDGKTYRNKVSSADLNQIREPGSIRVLKSNKELNRQASKRMLYLMSLPVTNGYRTGSRTGPASSDVNPSGSGTKPDLSKASTGMRALLNSIPPMDGEPIPLSSSWSVKTTSIPGDANTWSARVAMVLEGFQK